MAEKADIVQAEAIEKQHVSTHTYDDSLETAPPMEHVAEYQEARHINLTWRSWAVVFVSCFAIMAQVVSQPGGTMYPQDMGLTMLVRGCGGRLSHRLHHS